MSMRLRLRYRETPDPRRPIVQLNKRNKLEHVLLKQLTYSKHLFIII